MIIQKFYLSLQNKIIFVFSYFFVFLSRHFFWRDSFFDGINEGTNINIEGVKFGYSN